MKHSPKTICQSFTCTNWLSKLVSILQFWEQEFRIYGAIHNLNILGYLEGSEWCLLLVLNLLPVCKLSRISKNIDKATCRVQSRVSTMHIFNHNAMRKFEKLPHYIKYQNLRTSVTRVAACPKAEPQAKTDRFGTCNLRLRLQRSERIHAEPWDPLSSALTNLHSPKL